MCATQFVSRSPPLAPPVADTCARSLAPNTVCDPIMFARENPILRLAVDAPFLPLP
jgi:hypothetical protein